MQLGHEESMEARYAIKIRVERDNYQNYLLLSLQTRPCFMRSLTVLQAEGKHQGSRFENIEKLKEAVIMDLDTFTVDVLHEAFTKRLKKFKSIEVRRSDIVGH